MTDSQTIKIFNSAKNKYNKLNEYIRQHITRKSSLFDELLKNSIFYFVFIIAIFHFYYFYISFIDKTVSDAEIYYLNIFNISIELFLCLYLIFRFHPFRYHELHSSDTVIIFSCSLFLLWTILVDSFFFKIPTVLSPSSRDKVLVNTPDNIINTYTNKNIFSNKINKENSTQIEESSLITNIN